MSLEGADLTCAKLTGADLSGANLEPVWLTANVECKSEIRTYGIEKLVHVFGTTGTPRIFGVLSSNQLLRF